MQDMNDLLGMRLDDALALLEARGETAEVLISSSPRGQRECGTLRVVRVRPGQITACAFMDGIPQG